MENRNDIFDNKKAPIDKDALWNTIVSNEDFPSKDTTNKPYIYAVITLVALSFIGCIGYYYSTNINDLKSKTSIAKTSIENTITTHVSNSIYTKAKQESPINQSSSENQKTNNNINSLEQNLEKYIPNNNVYFNKKQINENILVSIPSTNIENNISKVKTQLNIISEQSSNNLNVINPQIGSKRTHTSITSNTGIRDLNKELNTTSNVLYNPINNDQLNSKEKSNSHLSTTTKYLIIDSISNLVIRSSYLKNPLYNINNQNITPIDTKSILRTKWSIGLNYWIGHNYEDLIINNNDLQWFYDNQTNVEQHAYEMVLNRTLKSNWSLGMGISYANLYQKYNVQSTNNTYTQNSHTKAPYYNRTAITKNRIIYHNHNIVDATINIQKQLLWKTNSIDLKLGIGGNLFYGFKGQIIDNNSNLTNINRTVYNKLISPYLVGGIGISKKINRTISINWGIEFQSSRTLSNNNKDIKHKYSQLRTGLGVNYSL